MDVTEAGDRCQAIIERADESIVAKRRFLEAVLTGILSRGHVLIEDVPGTGKTLTARTFAEIFGLTYSRIQFTPDLLPSDVTGTFIFSEHDETFEFNRGPIFANMVLADEINRAPPKTQAALLEAMGEDQVTVDGEEFALPDPFFVIATQNPVEHEGTFPLPEAQLDRFIIKTSIGYPDIDGQLTLLNRRERRNTKSPTATQLLEPSEVREIQAVPENVTVKESLKRYMISVCEETRADERTQVGVSPRGLQRLFEATRARAVIHGRDFVTPDDVKGLAPEILAHRLVLTTEATVREVNRVAVVNDILSTVPVPGREDADAVSSED